jgi:dihydropteroate synthase
MVGDGLPVAVMGVVNVSPESFHAGSVYRGEEAIVRAALEMVEAGAALIDVGARSTAPYLATEIDEPTEAARLGRAVELLAGKLTVPISADTARPEPARAALDAGARVLNDVSTLRDPRLARLTATRGASLILMAHPPGKPPRSLSAVDSVNEILGDGLRRAAAAGIPVGRIVVDPGIGFFRDEAMAWHEWDLQILAGLRGLRGLRRPICVGVSRKSFLGAITGRRETGERLAASLAATAVAVANGAALVRTHDVAETRDAVRVAERVRAVRR